MTLKEIILNEEKEKDSDIKSQSWKEYITALSAAQSRTINRLDSVMRWASLNGWVLSHSGKWLGSHASKTDAELLQLYKEKNP